MYSRYPHDYVVFDTETTGLGYGARIIEISAIRVCHDETIDSFSSLIHAPEPLSQTITKLTGITDEMLADAPLEDEVIPSFFDFAGNSTLVGHNISFDLRMLDYAAERLNIRLPRYATIDTCCMARERFPAMRRHRLCDMINRLGIGSVQDHRAMQDVLQTDACYRAMRDMSDKECEACNQNEALHVLPPCENPLAFVSEAVLFTGTLEHISRSEAEAIVTTQGGTVKHKASRNITILVQGDEDPRSFGKSEKRQRTEELIANGRLIEIIDEQAFLFRAGYRQETRVSHTLQAST